MEEQLIDAIFKNDFKTVSELLIKGIDPNICLDGDKITPLHFAAQLNRLKIARLLLLMGADPLARGVDGSTPLSVAKQFCLLKMQKLLLQFSDNKTIH